MDDDKENQPQLTEISQLSPELIDQLRNQLIADIKGENERERQQAIKQREETIKAHTDFVEKMKNSPDPWVDINGWVETAQGLRVDLDWNDAFVKYLRSNGVSGVDDDQVVQRWITLLLRDMSDQIEEQSTNNNSKFS